MRPFIVAILVFSMSLPAVAFDPGPRKRLPKVPWTTVDGVRVKVLTGEQWTSVLAVSSQNKALYEWRIKVLPAIEAFDLVKEAHKKEVDSLNFQISIMQVDLDYKDKRISVTDEAFEKERKRKAAGVVVWQIAAGLELAAIIVLSFFVIYQNTNGPIVINGG